MTDEARMADDGCTQEPGEARMPTRLEAERVIVAYAEATQEVYRFGDEGHLAFNQASRELTKMLDRIPWGDA